MGLIANLALTAALLLVLVPVGLFVAEVLAGLLPRRPAPEPSVPRRRVAVVVPAHDEAAVIERTLLRLSTQLQADDRLLVVADNCSDDTARIARSTGAEVIERIDPARRGKGYALDCAIRNLAADPPRIVVFIDADCEFADGSLDRIARLCEASRRPVQALYLMLAPERPGTMVQVGQFAWTVRNHVRPLGCLRLGMPCQLMGTGMALPWRLAQALPLASSNLVEDMRMGIDCARLGHPPLFCPEAQVTSRFPAVASAARSQRTRWEHGHLAMICSQVPRLLGEGLRGRNWGLLAIVWDMCIPPLALLVLALLGLGLAAGLVGGFTGRFEASFLALGQLAALAVALVLAWLRFGTRSLPARDLLRIAPYVLSKIPLYLQFLSRRQTDWVRSRRDGR